MDFNLNNYDRPVVCEQCSGIMVYKGLGEYICEDCGLTDYDDYGKVRNFIEDNPGSNINEIAENTGVKKRSINNMLKESRFVVASDSKTFLLCEICGISIRSGRYCPSCESRHHSEIEKKARVQKSFSGFGMQDEKADKGSKRFTRGQ